MNHTRLQEPQLNKGSTSWHREHTDESADKRPTDRTASPTQLTFFTCKVLMMKVTVAALKAFVLQSYSFPRDDHHSFFKPGFSNQRYHHFNPHSYFHRKDHFQLHHIALRERDREKERYEQRERTDGSSPPKQKDTTRPSLPKCTPSRDKDIQFTASQSSRNQNRERDHRGSKSIERERSRDSELPLTVGQTAARDRAIQQKRKEIDEVYYQECEMFGLVVKMLIAKDPSLEHPIQSSLQANLRDIGRRCVEAMEKFIEDYDSKEPSH
ncbi:hypothetical protein PAMP_012220 [Pampus punctatissimus]